MAATKRKLTERDLRRANIPERYWKGVRLGNIPEDAPYREEFVRYLKNTDRNIEHGDGIILYSKANGTGKTAMATIALRIALQRGYTGFYIRSSALQGAVVKDRMFDEWTRVEDRVRNVDLFVLDDFGKEHKAKSGFTENMIEDILRERIQRARATIITTNLAPGLIKDHYSEDLASVLRESAVMIQVHGAEAGGVNWRDKKKKELQWRQRAS